MENKDIHLPAPQERIAPLQEKKYLASFISGGLSGIVAKSVIAPFDRIKILFQVVIMGISYLNLLQDYDKTIHL